VAVLARPARLLVLLDDPAPLACCCSDWPCLHGGLILDNMLWLLTDGRHQCIMRSSTAMLHAYCMQHLGFTVDDPGLSTCSCLDDPGMSPCSCLDDPGMSARSADQCMLRDLFLHPALQKKKSMQWACVTLWSNQCLDLPIASCDTVM